MTSTSARIFRVVLLLSVTFVFVEYLFGSLVDVSVVRNYVNLQVRLNGSSNATNTGIYHTATEYSTINNKSAAKSLCPETPAGLGPITANITEIELEEINDKYPEVEWGGIYSPPHCRARHKVAIIVPYRDRVQHLAIFLNHLHPFLMKQQLEYGIFVIEQYGEQPFNRAKLMNVGYRESQQFHEGGWQCSIFHDIDLLPTNSRHIYSCPRLPRHMSAAIDKFNYKLPYKTIFGGVTALTNKQFEAVNGFANRFWGWGGEDDDMLNRIKWKNIGFERSNLSIATYTMLRHESSKPNPKRWMMLKKPKSIIARDGLSSLQYDIMDISRHQLYTNILVDIGLPQA